MKLLLHGALCAGLFGQVSLMAQGPGASITGEVRDPSGAVLVQAAVTARNFGNITYLIDAGNSSFNSLIAKLDKRLSHGLSYLISYTYGKSIDEGSGPASTSDASGGVQNSNNLFAGERGLSDFDVRHRLVISPIWARRSVLPGKVLPTKSSVAGRSPASSLFRLAALLRPMRAGTSVLQTRTQTGRMPFPAAIQVMAHRTRMSG